MSRSVSSMGVFGLAALVIALAAFGIAQVFPGKGMPVVAMVSGLWVAFVVARGRKVA